MACIYGNEIEDEYYWVFFDNDWNLMVKNDGLWFWTDGAPCYKCDDCIVLPVHKPRSDDACLKQLKIEGK